MTSPGPSLAAWLPQLRAAWRGGKTACEALSARDVRRLGSALKALQRGLTGDRRLIGATYMEENDLLGAYLLYYWPVSYLETSLALAMIGRPASRVLDLGAGPGPAAAAFLDRGARELHLVDASPKALSLAERLLGPRTARLATQRADLENLDSLPPGPFDAIVISHAMNELWKNAPDRLDRRSALLEKAADLLAPGGFLLLIEPAPLGTSREALALRDALCHNSWTVLAPCLHSKPCPLLGLGPDRTCHAEAAWNPPPEQAALAAQAGLDRSSVKATWFAVLPPGSAASGAPCEPEKPGGARPKGSVDVEPREAPILGPGRVVSAPLLNKAGRVRYLVCARDGLEKLSAHPEALPGGSRDFLSLARYDLIAVENPEKREGGAWGLGAESLLRLEDRAPRIEP